MMKLVSRPYRRLLWIVGIGLACLLPFQPWLYPVFLMELMCFGLFAAAFNLLIGYTGLLSFGHAAFFGVAGYVTGKACNNWALTPELGMLCGVLASTLLGWLFGALAIRRQGIYFAMITLALAQMVYFVCVQLPQTGGEEGLIVPRGKLFGLVDLSSDVAMFYCVLTVFLAGMLLVWRVVHSPFGEMMKSVRDNEARAVSLGVNADRVKLLAFTLSAALTGLAGATKAIVFQLVTWTDVHWHTSGDVVVMSLLGGIGTTLGPWVGAAMVIGLQHYLADIGSWSPIVIGLVFVACVLSFRRGVVGEFIAALRWRSAPGTQRPGDDIQHSPTEVR
ncbi:branched-chain amino acid ABC transporter permease [Cupriavidus sp. D39]|uniref:branched-chain amino acid ABC transporter permease n=1 Tax=Cupriavidus sp. D39 TaxID=2997877 RepID=UPI002270C5F0|nr:branched-chain amino acid ABC transporter permease [Cupriavidus sp. D39]MCY0854675.1 branched-chain amino acid ABC transporter permease [Cupriavidus sp. D39]